jgi:hypothetical protein
MVKSASYITDDELQHYFQSLKNQILNDIEKQLLENKILDHKVFEIILNCRNKNITIQGY